MSTLLAAMQQSRPIGQSRIGPYPTALLARERAVLLEWVSPANKRARRRGRLRASARVGAPLVIELGGAETSELPSAGTRVMLVVPVQNSLWRFTTVAEADAPGMTALSLAWPAEVTQEAGRRFERARCVLPIAVEPGGQTEARTLCTYTLDVSMGGAQIAVPTSLPIGTPLRLSIRLPKETVSAAATVAWSRMLRDEPGDPMYSAGVQFVSLPARVAARLRVLLGANGMAAH